MKEETMVSRIADRIRLHTTDATWTPEGLAIVLIEAMHGPTGDMIGMGAHFYAKHEVGLMGKTDECAAIADAWDWMLVEAVREHRRSSP